MAPLSTRVLIKVVAGDTTDEPSTAVNIKSDNISPEEPSMVFVFVFTIISPWSLLSSVVEKEKLPSAFVVVESSLLSRIPSLSRSMKTVALDNGPLYALPTDECRLLLVSPLQPVKPKAIKLKTKGEPFARSFLTMLFCKASWYFLNNCSEFINLSSNTSHPTVFHYIVTIGFIVKSSTFRCP